MVAKVRPTANMGIEMQLREAIAPQVALGKLGMQFHDGLAFMPKHEDEPGNYWFVSTVVDSQRDSDGMPMCTLMPTGDGGYLNLALEVGPNSVQTEKLRALIAKELAQQDDVSDVVLSELPLSITTVNLWLGDRSGAAHLLQTGQSSGQAPHGAMFMLALDRANFALVNAALGGEEGILVAEYELNIEFPRLLRARMTVDTEFLIDQFSQRELWHANWNRDDASQRVTELLKTRRLSIEFFHHDVGEQALRKITQELITSVIDWFEIAAQARIDEAGQYDECQQIVSFERELKVAQIIPLLIRTDAAHWSATAI